jgi:uncharacterized damage-inducible protein DinB
MLPLLNLGEVQHPELVDVFLKNPDKSGLPKPATSRLREYWKAANKTLIGKLTALTPEQWFERHTSVSEEDFKKEPHRNKLDIVAGRTTHMTYHIGQIALIK